MQGMKTAYSILTSLLAISLLTCLHHRLTAQIHADFTHRFLVDSACVHPEDPYIVELRDMSSGAIASNTWFTNHPRVASITAVTKGSAMLALDIMRGTPPTNVAITLLAKDSLGNTDTITKTIYLNLHYAPIVKFSQGLSIRGCATDTLEFRQQAFSLHSSTLTTYHWDFGDSATTSSQNPTHVYATPGTYQVSLKVTDDTGCTGGDHYASYKLRAKIGPAAQCQ